MHFLLARGSKMSCWHTPDRAIFRLKAKGVVMPQGAELLFVTLIVDCTNINHKGLQRTANEYAEERRIVDCS